MILGSLSILAAVGLAVNLAIHTWDRINIHGRAIILSIFPFPAILYLLLLMIGALLVTLSMITWQDGLDLYSQGLSRRTGRKVKTWLFEDTNRFDTQITQVTFGGSMVSSRMKIIFERSKDDYLVLHNSYEQMPDLVDQLRALVLPELIRKSRQRLLLGESLHFHKNIQASMQGLMVQGNPIPYKTIAITFENQAVKLHALDNPKQVFFKSQIQHISNLDLLINLLENPPSVR